MDKFIFPIDLIVLDMEEDKSIPLILGRLFLATTRAVIDVGEGKLILKLGDDQIEFNFCNNMKFPPEVENCMMIKTTNEPAVAKKNQNFSYPTIDQYVEKLKLKEAGNVELSRKEKYFQKLMRFETKKVEIREVGNDENFKSKPPDEEQQLTSTTINELPQIKESCFVIDINNEFEENKSPSDDNRKHNEVCYVISSEEGFSPEKKKKVKLKSSLRKLHRETRLPLDKKENVIKEKWNQVLNKKLKMWMSQHTDEFNFKDPP